MTEMTFAKLPLRVRETVKNHADLKYFYYTKVGERYLVYGSEERKPAPDWHEYVHADRE